MTAPNQTPDQVTTPPQGANHPLSRLRFAEFEVDFEERQLRRDGWAVKIQKKPFEILRLLLERPGALVTRAGIARVLWPELHVSYERSLNTAVNALREALGDSGRKSRLIETCSGAGYRFIAAVEPVGRPQAAGTSKEGTSVDAARRDYLTGEFFFNKMSDEGLTTASAHFSSAIQEDASYAPPYAGLAQINNFFAFWGILDPREAGKRASEYARSAVWLCSGRPEAYVAMAGVKRVVEWDWAGAERLYRKALDLEPCCEQARVWYADLLLCQGRSREALVQTQAALAHAPLSQWASYQHAWTLLVLGEHRKALEHVWHALVLDPSFGLGHFLLGLIYQQMEMADDAIIELENARRSSPLHPLVLAALGHVYASSGEAAQARKLLDELIDLSKRRYVSAYCVGVLHAGLGNNDACIGEFQKALDGRDIHLQWMCVDPRIAELRRSDSRFALISGRMGLQCAEPNGR